MEILSKLFVKKINSCLLNRTLRLYFSTTRANLENHRCKLLIVGGGSGGCTMAAKFSKILKKNQVIIVEPSDVHYYGPLFTFIAAGVKKFEESNRPMIEVLPGKAKWVKNQVVEFIPEKDMVLLSNGESIMYEFMLVAVGLQLNYNEIPGLIEALKIPNSGVCSNYSADYVMLTYKAMQNFKSGNAIFTFPNTAVKCAGAPQKICYLTEHYLRKVGKRNKANIIYNTSSNELFKVKRYADALWKVVRQRNINVNLNTNLIEVKPKEKLAVFQNLNEPKEKIKIDYSMLHVPPPMGPPDVLKKCTQLVENTGFVNVDKDTLQHVNFPNIFAIGDCCCTPNSKTTAAVGTGESGKTTIIKQMKILHINGFSEKEKKEKIANIKQNIHESIYTLVTNMSKISPPVTLQQEENKKSAEYILKLGLKEPDEYSDEYYDHVTKLWADPGIKEAFRRSNEFQLIDSAKHFLDRIEDIRQPNYIPTVQDMLFCRIMTIAISKIEFKIPYKGQNVEFWMYDVGGQRGERKKWISVFEGIDAILFLIAASDFDQTLREDEKRNRLVEAFKVFSDIFWSRFVRQTGKIVFLNKQDLLKQKIENGQRLANYFPEFANYKPANKTTSEYDRAKFYMRDKIIHIAQNTQGTETVDWIPGEQVEVDVQSQDVYIHFTIATDTKNVKLVFDSVKDMILKENLEKLGLY